MNEEKMQWKVCLECRCIWDIAGPDEKERSNCGFEGCKNTKLIDVVMKSELDRYHKAMQFANAALEYIMARDNEGEFDTCTVSLKEIDSILNPKDGEKP